jgi:Gas vesicle synthesis protein GvpL/GvpF
MKPADRAPGQPVDDAEARGRDGRDEAESSRGQAVYLYGMTRARSWRSGPLGRNDIDVQRVRYRDLEALVRPVTYELPTLDTAQVQQHQQVVEMAMRRGTILPAPYGIVFRGRRPLIRMLQEQYLVLDEGLSFLDGHWELRLHIGAAQQEPYSIELGDLAMQLYSELRRFARAAVPFPAEERRLLSAAFLVERASWLEFMTRAEDLGSAHPDLTFDITGPWPAYDFVRIIE